MKRRDPARPDCHIKAKKRKKEMSLKIADATTH